MAKRCEVCGKNLTAWNHAWGTPKCSNCVTLQEVVCTECYFTFNATPKRSSLGFERFICPKCNKNVVYPLTFGRRMFYLIFAVLMGIRFVNVIGQGGLPLFSPGSIVIIALIIVGIAMVVALVKDVSIVKKFQRAQDQHRKPE